MKREVIFHVITHAMESELAKFKKVDDYYVFADFETSVELRFHSLDNNMVMKLVNVDDFHKITPFDFRQIINHFEYPYISYTKEFSENLCINMSFERTLNTEYPVATLSFLCKEDRPCFTYRVNAKNGKLAKYNGVISVVGCADREVETLTDTNEYRIPDILTPGVNEFLIYAQYITATMLSFTTTPCETIEAN